MEWSNPLSIATRFKDNIARKLEQRERMIKLLTEHKAHQEYPWFQGTESGVVSTGGICHGMSFDWLRRKFLTKRNYNDPRFASWTADPGNLGILSKVKDLVMPEMNAKRRAVMQKAGEIQAGFYNELRLNDVRWKAAREKLLKTKPAEELTIEDFLKEDSTLVYPHAHDAETQILKRFALSRTKKMRGLECFHVSEIKVDWLSTETVVKDKNDVGPFVSQHIANMAMEPSGLQRGLMVSFQDEDDKVPGHATAIYHNRTDDQKQFVFFDPNCGEFFWGKAYELGMFVGELWDIAYPHLRKLCLRTVTLDPQDVPPKSSDGKGEKTA
jgi:hypothetical protein